MKILIPVDETDRHESVLKFIGHLKCPDVEVRFAHVVPPIGMADGSFASLPYTDEADLLAFQMQQAKERLASACEHAKHLGFSTSSVVDLGFVGEMIELRAAEFGADLVAIASIPKNSVEKIFSGSVALWLVKDCRRDLLIVRSDQPCREACSLVFAADHTEASSVCLDRFLSWRWKGICRAEVLYAHRTAGTHTPAGGTHAKGTESLDDVLKGQVLARTQQIADRVSRAGIQAHATTIEAPIAEAIRQTMSATGSDLLVLASQEHTFWENLLGKSTTLHEASTEPYSLLILRELESKPPFDLENTKETAGA
jgi:nucleotide-binding universal stress UspA family protein